MKTNIKAYLGIKLIEEKTDVGTSNTLIINNGGDTEDFQNISEMFIKMIESGDCVAKSNFALLSSIVEYIKNNLK